jgi:galactokinase
VSRQLGFHPSAVFLNYLKCVSFGEPKFVMPALRHAQDKFQAGIPAGCSGQIQKGSGFRLPAGTASSNLSSWSQASFGSEREI